MIESPGIPDKGAWRQVVSPFEQPDRARALAQLANTLIPFFALFALMYASLRVFYPLTLALAVPTALYWVRLFVLFHDCTHRALFPSSAANIVAGNVLGLLTLTPYFQWRHGHGLHHGSAGNLDRRSSADVWTLTVREYLELPRAKRVAYRVFRNPFSLFVLGPIFKLALWDRLPNGHGKRELGSVYGTDLALIAILVTAYFTVGLKTFLIVTAPPMVLAYSFGIWLFYVQHNFEDTYWEHHGEWDYAAAALHGSSFYRLPWLLQWFTASIGYHHLHHLSPRIPNYRLQECHENNPLFRDIPEMTLRSSLKCLGYRLWDEDSGQMVGWNHLRTCRAAQPG